MEIKWLKKSELLYWLWLALKLNNGSTAFEDLIETFGGSAYSVYRADEFALKRVSGLSDAQRKTLLDKNMDDAMSVLNFCKDNGVGIVTYADKCYPDGLRSMKKPPIVFYYVGKLPDFNNRVSVSVVGTRKMTEYGMRSCYKIAYELACAGAIVVSGMALGIDSIAHAGAIGGRGETVAILGCGIDVIYPHQHRKLRSYITANGAVITPYPPGTPAFRGNFPERNAMISAISEGTVIVEAPLHSGALITAEHAAEQSRAIYALPGSIEEPMSAGPNELIKRGATAITCARDVLRYYFENKSKLVDPVKLRQGELSSEFDMDILDKVGISATTFGHGPKETPASLLKKLNEQLTNNKEQNSDYYSVPKIKKLGEQRTAEKDGSHPTPERVEKPVNTSAPSDAVLASLTDVQRKIYEDLPDGRAVPLDELVSAGNEISSLMAGLTVLEIRGLISSLPGGLYLKK